MGKLWENMGKYGKNIGNISEEMGKHGKTLDSMIDRVLRCLTIKHVGISMDMNRK
jgi:hypothetical protein